MTSAQRTGAESASTKIAIGLVAVLALLALVVGMNSGPGPGQPVLLAPSPPTRMTVPALSLTSTLVPTGLNPDRTLEVPPLSRPMQASWYEQSPTPGAIGPAIVLGHINGGGQPGIFANLDKIQGGQDVLVDRADGQTAVFTVSRVDTVPKDTFPTADVYEDTADSQLRLITCGGEFDRSSGSYLFNVIVYATLTSARPTGSTAP